MKKILVALSLGFLILFTNISPGDDFNNWLRVMKKHDKEFEDIINSLEAWHKGGSQNKSLLHKELVQCKNNPNPTPLYSERVHREQDQLFYRKLDEVRAIHRGKSSSQISLKKQVQRLQNELMQCRSQAQ